MSTKGSACFQILSCYFVDARLKLLCVKFAYKHKKNKKEEFRSSSPPNYLTSEEASLCMFKFPNLLKNI